MLNDIANRFNRSLETIRKMSDDLGLTILKKEVSVASVDSNLNAPLNPLSNLPRPPLKKWRSHFKQPLRKPG